jgi:hypothetical protein
MGEFFGRCDCCGKRDLLSPMGAAGQEAPIWCRKCFKNAGDEALAEMSAAALAREATNPNDDNPGLDRKPSR